MKSKDQQLLEEAYDSVGPKHVYVLMKDAGYEGDRIYGIYTSQHLHAAVAAAKQLGDEFELKMVPVNGTPSIDYLHIPVE